MTIKEIEQITGLSRSNIRFYEKENLISPSRNNNGYRDYSREDVNNLKKIICLRTLGVSVEEIRKLNNKEKDLFDVISHQRDVLNEQLFEMEKARILCERMLNSDHKVTYEDLDIEKYVSDIDEYRKQNKEVFKLDSLGLFYKLGGLPVWTFLTVACFIIALLSFGILPSKIPIQWKDGRVTSAVDKMFIFAYPIMCVMVRFLLRISIWNVVRKSMFHVFHIDALTDYIVNSLCFVILTVEIFSILYIYEIVTHVTVLLLVDAVIIVGLLLLAGFNKK